MSITTQCPHCKSKLKLKDSKHAGKEVNCPKCAEPFTVRPLTQKPVPQSPALPPKVLQKKKKKPRETPADDDNTNREPGKLKRIFSVLVWLNAHLAVGVCIIDNFIDFGWVLTHWNEVYEQSVIGRIATRRLGRPVLVMVTAGIVWFQGVLPRDIAARGTVVLFGGGYLFLFGLVALIIGVAAESIYKKPIYAIQWSVIYLGVSLLAFAVWGFGPETTLQRAERMMANGRFEEAMQAVDLALTEDPDDDDALQLERALRDMMRYG